MISHWHLEYHLNSLLWSKDTYDLVPACLFLYLHWVPLCPAHCATITPSSFISQSTPKPLSQSLVWLFWLLECLSFWMFTWLHSSHHAGLSSNGASSDSFPADLCKTVLLHYYLPHLPYFFQAFLMICLVYLLPC